MAVAALKDVIKQYEAAGASFGRSLSPQGHADAASVRRRNTSVCVCFLLLFSRMQRRCRSSQDERATCPLSTPAPRCAVTPPLSRAQLRGNVAAGGTRVRGARGTIRLSARRVSHRACRVDDLLDPSAFGLRTSIISRGVCDDPISLSAKPSSLLLSLSLSLD